MFVYHGLTPHALKAVDSYGPQVRLLMTCNNVLIQLSK